VDIATGGSTDLRSEGVRRARRRVCVSDDEYLENNIFRVTSSRASEVEGLVGLGPSPEERARLGCRGFGVHDGGLACDSERLRCRPRPRADVQTPSREGPRDAPQR
jgi:hypothetical protein